MDAEQLKNLRVAVLAGGWSDERDISMQSGTQCRQALLDAGFAQVDLYDIAEKDFPQRFVAGGYDVAFPALHGRYGADGCIQGFVETRHCPSALSGVVTPRGNGACFAPRRGHGREELAAAIELAGAAGQRVLVEECIEGTEITVPVIGNDEPEALPVVEIAYDAEFYDLKVKYEPSALHHIIPARLSPEVYALAQDMACRAHKALGCRGCSRSDFIVTAAGEPIILETNTIPGMTASSLLPDSARHAGIEFPQLCTRFVELALEA